MSIARVWGAKPRTQNLWRSTCKCGTAGELHANDSVKKLTQEVESVNFQMRSAVIEIRGLCANCVG
jgi:Fe2+ or Zn2+ uptake regulation protein